MHWDDVQFFLSVARNRTLASAAKKAGVDATTVGRRIERLAAALNAELFEPGPAGYRLTSAGEAFLVYAEEMERSAVQAGEALGGQRTSYAGRVRLSVAEGLAMWVLADAVPRLNARHPGIALDIITGNGFLNPTKREADVAVMLARPARGPLITRKLADYGLGLYATQDYLARTGTPHKSADLAHHRLIGYTPDFIFADELRYLPEISDQLDVAETSSSILVQHRMIASGAGIGVLPHFIALRDATLAPVIPDLVAIKRSLWLVVHRDLQRVARIEAVKDWLAETIQACPFRFPHNC